MTRQIAALTWQDQSDADQPLANYGVDFSIDRVWQFNLAGTYHLNPILPLGMSADNTQGTAAIRIDCAAFTASVLPYTRQDFDLTNVSQQLSFTAPAGITYSLPIVFWRRQPSGAQQNQYASQRAAVSAFLPAGSMIAYAGASAPS